MTPVDEVPRDCFVDLCGDAFQDRMFEFMCRQRTAEVEALDFVAAVTAQEFELLRCFHAFGDHPLLQALGHADDGAGDCGVVRIGDDILYE